MTEPQYSLSGREGASREWEAFRLALLPPALLPAPSPCRCFHSFSAEAHSEVRGPLDSPPVSWAMAMRLLWATSCRSSGALLSVRA